MGCKLERVNDYVCSQMCFEELWGSGDFNVVGVLCENQTATQASFSHRDRLLLKMTLIQRIFQKLSDNQYNCANLWKICETLVTECNLLEDLINCLDSSDQVIAFSACKSLVKVVVGLPLSSLKTEWFKESLLNFDKCKPQANQHSWRLLYTMEFLRQIVRFCHGNQDAIPAHTGLGVKICDCGAPKQKYSVSKCALINMVFACDKWVVHTLPLCMPFWDDLWRVSLQELEAQDLGTKLSTFSNVSSVIHQKTWSSNGLDENALVSFLMFLLEVVKCIQKTETQEEKMSSVACGKCVNMPNFSGSDDEQNQAGNSLSDNCEAAPKDQQCLITTEVQMLLKVVPVLISLLHLPSLSAICFKNVLNVLWQVFVPLEIISPQTDLTRSYLLVRQSSAALISGVCCCLLKNIPQTTGCAGFGGQEWRSLGDNNPPKADPACLRKLSLLLLKACYAILEYGADEPEGVVFDTIMSWSSDLKHLVHGAIPKTSSPQQCSEEGMSSDLLIKLFSDQDDELVEALLFLLRIYQKAQSVTNERQNQSWSSFFQRFNPHGLFIPLLDSICFDHSVLLDFLISPETCFLSYFLSYLRFILSNWELFSYSIKRYEEVDERDSCKLLSTLQGSVKEEEERHCPALYSHLPLSLDNAPCSKADDSCGKGSSTLPREPSITGDSATKRCGEARHERLGCLQDIAVAYESEESNEESEEDVVLMEMDTNSSAPGISSCDKSIEEAANTRDTTVEKLESHYLNRFGYESNTDIRADCVSVSRCEQFILEDTGGVVGDSEVKSAAEPTGGDLPDVMGRLMAALIRLRLSVERLHRGGLFPYNVEPLLRSMRTVERLYDGC